MSLKVWLPLNGNLKNQGTGTATISGTASYSTDGKIGKCLSSSSAITVNLPEIANSKIWSVCFWGYVTSSLITSDWTRIIRIGDGGDMFRVEVCPKTYGNGIYCYSTHNNAAYKISTGSVQAKSGGYYDQWMHFCVASDGTTIYVYHNGTLAGTQNYTGTGAITGYFYLENNDKIKKNDFRIYNKCLSKKEVREISKALILHFPLNCNGIGVPNMVSNSTTFSGWSIGSGWVSGTSDNGMKMYSFSRTGATSNNWVRIIPTLKIDANNYADGVTVSMDLFTPDVSAINQKCLMAIQAYNESGSRCGWHEPGTDISNVVNNKWCRISHYFTKSQLMPNQQGLTYSYTMFSFQLVQNGNISIRKIKVEPGNTATDYAINPSDINDSRELDTSGYGNHGTRTGTITGLKDTARYESSSKFDNASYITYQLPATNIYYATYSFWLKFSSFTAYGAIHIQLASPSGGDSPWFSCNTEFASLWCYFGGNSPNYTKAGSGDLAANKWHHCVYVWNNGVAQWYLNGSKYGNTVTYTGKKYIPSTTKASIGDSYTGTSWNGTPFNGQLSDFRVYATALTDEDILNLYKTSSSVDKNGNIFNLDFHEN